MVRKEFFWETKNIEFKREIPSKHEKFLKDIIAFSNSTGGHVVVGIEDETCIVYGIGEQSPFKLFEEPGDGFLVKMFRKQTNQTKPGNQKDQIKLMQNKIKILMSVI